MNHTDNTMLEEREVLPAIIEVDEVEVFEQDAIDAEHEDIRLRVLYRKLKWAKVFLEELRKCPVIGEAARVAGVATNWTAKARKKYPLFDQLCEEAIQDGADVLVKEAIDRATKPCNKGEKYSDILLIFLIKRWKPEFRDSYDFTKQQADAIQTGVQSIRAFLRGPDDIKSIDQA